MYHIFLQNAIECDRFGRGGLFEAFYGALKRKAFERLIFLYPIPTRERIRKDPERGWEEGKQAEEQSDHAKGKDRPFF